MFCVITLNMISNTTSPKLGLNSHPNTPKNWSIASTYGLRPVCALLVRTMITNKQKVLHRSGYTYYIPRTRTWMTQLSKIWSFLIKKDIKWVLGIYYTTLYNYSMNFRYDTLALSPVTPRSDKWDRFDLYPCTFDAGAENQSLSQSQTARFFALSGGI